MTAERCPRCNTVFCAHGCCECFEETCPDCLDRFNREKEAEIEANWQRNVMGPALGLVPEHVHDWRGIDTGRICAICCKTEEL